MFSKSAESIFFARGNIYIYESVSHDRIYSSKRKISPIKIY